MMYLPFRKKKKKKKKKKRLRPPGFAATPSKAKRDLKKKLCGNEREGEMRQRAIFAKKL